MLGLLSNVSFRRLIVSNQPDDTHLFRVASNLLLLSRLFFFVQNMVLRSFLSGHGIKEESYWRWLGTMKNSQVKYFDNIVEIKGNCRILSCVFKIVNSVLLVVLRIWVSNQFIKLLDLNFWTNFNDSNIIYTYLHR